MQEASSQTASQFNSWYMYFGNHKLNDNFSLHTEYQFRRHGVIQEWQQSLARIGLDYKLTDQAMITGGYAWIISFPYGEQPIPLSFAEHRIWQQLITTQKVKRVSLQHRYRLEQRFLENVALNANSEKEVEGYRFRQRARYRIMTTVPLSKKSLEDNTLFLALYEEAFLGFGEGIGPNILDQNRLYAALGWRFDASSNVQLGYLFHKVFKADGLQQENNHTFQVAWTKNLAFN